MKKICRYVFLILFCMVLVTPIQADRISLRSLEARIAELEMLPKLYPFIDPFTGTTAFFANQDPNNLGCSVFSEFGEVVNESNNDGFFNLANRFSLDCFNAEDVISDNALLAFWMVPDSQYKYDGVYLCAQVDPRAIDRVDARNTFRLYVTPATTSYDPSTNTISHTYENTVTSTNLTMDLGTIHESEFPRVGQNGSDSVSCKVFKFENGVNTSNGPVFTEFAGTGRLEFLLQFPELDSRKIDIEVDENGFIVRDGDFVIINEIGLTVSGRN